jgi:two-component sensor histidine kinase
MFSVEDHSRESEREILLAELDHRVKNVLAAVQSLASQSARRAVSLDGFLKDFSGRLKAMASAQELLTATRWRGASLHHLAAAELGPLAPGRTRWEGPDLILTPRATNAMSLALHELAVNAVKYGALSVDSGRVLVRWKMIENGGFELEWSETGGPTVPPLRREGFGLLLLTEVTGRELGGDVNIQFNSGGVRAVIRADAHALAAAETPVPAPERRRQSRGDEAAAGASQGPPSATQAAEVRGLKVIIVEDAVLLALELETGLSDAGAVVLGCAAELDEAMALIDLPMDAAVLDANLNGQSVRPVAEALARRGIPFIFATGYGEAGGAPEGFDVPIVRKPYDVTQIAAALAEVTRQAAH